MIVDLKMYIQKQLKNNESIMMLNFIIVICINTGPFIQSERSEFI